MTLLHRIYLFLLAATVLVVVTLVSVYGYGYYQTGIEDRFFHPLHNLLKPGGIWGHGYGIIGSLAMILGVGLYMAKKRVRALSRLGRLKYWLEFHIFLCTLGPFLVLFHTAFKFGGIVAISFWSMVAVFLSGIVGRFIYLQIPHTIEGRALSLQEIRDMQRNAGESLTKDYSLDEESRAVIAESTRKKIEVERNFISDYFIKYFEDRKTISRVKAVVKKNNLSPAESKRLMSLVKSEISMNRRIDRLTTMQNLFRYWHVIHLPFAIVMLIIMIIHVGVTIAFGYRWIF
jgi:hypothetical protein